MTDVRAFKAHDLNKLIQRQHEKGNRKKPSHKAGLSGKTPLRHDTELDVEQQEDLIGERPRERSQLQKGAECHSPNTQ